jgi:hypothetical protein
MQKEDVQTKSNKKSLKVIQHSVEQHKREWHLAERHADSKATQAEQL